MPKQSANESVLHDWVHSLPFQMQALLLTGVRGPDENNKYNIAKGLIRYLRGAVIKPAGEWNGTNNNDFMWGDYSVFTDWAVKFFEDHDEYPHHFIMHLVHCAEVIGYRHPDKSIADHWLTFYYNACNAFHMNPESQEQLASRLNDFGCGYHSDPTVKGVVYRIYKDMDESKSSTILGAMYSDVTKEEFDRWTGQKEVIKEPVNPIQNN